jgi:hypothetical protein
MQTMGLAAESKQVNKNLFLADLDIALAMTGAGRHRALRHFE